MKLDDDEREILESFERGEWRSVKGAKIPPGQHLLIDADDTLWENNVYFERAIANFISFLNHHEYTPDQVRQVLYDVERENIRTHGYGMHSFALALVRCFERLSVEPLDRKRVV